MPAENEPQAPYHAGPGTAHEVGVMVAFIAAFFLSMGVYFVFWRVGNKRSERREAERRGALVDQKEKFVGGGGEQKGIPVGEYRAQHYENM